MRLIIDSMPSTLFFHESWRLFIVMTLVTIVAILICVMKKAIWFGSGIGMAYVLLVVALMVFYRVPERILPTDSAGALLAPCDGVVKAIERDERTGRVRIVVFLNIFDQHLQFYPTSGKVVKRDYVKGTFAPAYALEKSQHNERLRVEIRTERGIVGITQIAGQIARRIVNHARVGNVIQQGDYMGMIKLSSRVDIDFPMDAWRTLRVRVGDRIRANETKLAV